jgi:hypothetical protein
LPAEARAREAVAGEGWSGRRGSNPRPTAWKAVTLPLSYSRLRATHFAPALRRASPPRTRAQLLVLRRAGPLSRLLRSPLARQSISWLANRSSQSERKLVAREGLEPSKPLGRQIYSLLRLTASLPRQLSVLESVIGYLAVAMAQIVGAGEGI